MRIVREQMLCIISPKWAGGGEALSATCLDTLRELCRDVGVVHFASLALLPPRPGAACDGLPSLLLELAVDEGIRPNDLLQRLVNHPSGALWDLYQSYWPEVSPPSVGRRNEALLRFLLDKLSIADGAFVGPRDRTVEQVARERSLFEEARSYASTLAPIQKSTRAVCALALARWAFQVPCFEPLTRAAPRSFWRTSAVRNYVRRCFILSAAALLTSAMGVGALLDAAGLVHGDPEPLRGAVAGLYVGLRFLVAVLGAALAWKFVFGVLRALIAPWDRWLTALVREFERPNDAWSARVAYVFGWLVIIGAIGLGYVLGVYVGRGTDGLAGLLLSDRPVWQLCLMAAYAGVFTALLAILVWGLRRSRVSASAALPETGTDWLRRAFRRPIDESIPRAQQVHESIDRCEAELVAGTAHMISLTEFRWPFAWSAWWTRRVLRVVSFVGHVAFTEGRLGDAPGIQYSHWHIVDGGRRLLFCANFDGTFGGYLDDFILGPSGGTTLFWRWTCLRPRRAAAAGQPEVVHRRDFPPTRFLLYRGVKCELKFKAYARDSMVPHVFRFDACELTLDQKIRGTTFRDALFGARTDVSDDTIMRALES